MVSKEIEIAILFISASISISVFIEIFNFLFFYGIPFINILLHIFAFLIAIVPTAIFFYLRRARLIEIEENFVSFLKDLVEIVRGGTNLYQAIQHAKNNDYKALSVYVKRAANRMALGMPIDKALILFSKEINSKLISRIVLSLIESQNYGGNIIDTVESLSNIVLEVEKIREERKTFVSGQLITGYLIYFVFLAIIIGMDVFLFPQLVKFSGIGSAGTTSGIQGLSQEIISSFKTFFRDIIFIQGFFAGLLIGKMAEGSIVAGIKHSLIFSVVGLIAYLVSSVLFPVAPPKVA